ncbi:MAG TPA: ABC transporter substrate-binding protein [Bradyrhizobium sp.]|jgi:putative ABC transport system substrate-binding protein
MKRRDFAFIVIGAASVLPLRIQAQRAIGRMPRIGVLLPGTPTSFSTRTKAFLDALSKLGRVEGGTVEIEWKWANDRVDVLPELAAELVRSNVDVIVTGGTPAAKALKAATQSIPIVVAIMADPVAAGIVENLGRPGRNITGFSIVAPELGTKRLQLLKEIMPGMSSVAVLLNARNPQAQIELRELKAAAAAMRLEANPVDISATGGMQDAFSAMVRAGAQALVVLTDPVLFSERKLTVDLANSKRLPAVYPFQAYVEDGGLVSYGPSDADLFRRAAGYVDKILGGIKPGDLPVEQPTKFDLCVNLNAARTLGVTIPETFLTRADKVIE